MYVLISLVSLAVSAFYITYQYYAFRAKLPPGPKGFPLIGNLHQAPSIYPWRTFTEMGKKYGPVFSMQFGPTTVIVLTNWEAAHELLDKRSNIYSSRPQLPMVGDLISQGNRTVFLPYNDKWKAYHRIQGSFLNANMSRTYRPLQDVESKQLLSELLTHPDDFFFRFHRFSASLLFSLGYGKRMPKGNEPEFSGIDKLLRNLNEVFLQRWIVDLLPSLNALPEFLAPWKQYAKKIRAEEESFFVDLTAKAEEQPVWNWANAIHDMKDSKKLNHVELSYVLSNTYEAGSDTITDAMLIFVMAAVLNPAVMKKAQEEIDAAVGRDDLPTIEQVENLPYLNAVVKEVHRWRPVIPGGVPHAVTQDDEYMGYKIPKGATIMACHWAISLDPEVYEDPDAFKPERWIANPDLPLAQFGFGRRKCVGQHLGHAALLIVASRLLWAYDIGPAYEERDGKKVSVKVDSLAFHNGFNSAPLPFKASFVPRAGNVAGVLNKAFEDAEKDVDVLMRGVREEQVRLGLSGSGAA